MPSNPLVPHEPTQLYDSVLRTMRDSYEEELYLLQRVRTTSAAQRRLLLRDAIGTIDDELQSRDTPLPH